MRFTVLAALGFAVVLAGCTQPDDEVRPGTALGRRTCIAKEISDNGDKAPDLSSHVPCTTPHIFEILDIADVPESSLNGRTRAERLANRSDLAGTAGETFRSATYNAVAGDACERALRHVTGYDKLTVGGVDAETAELIPELNGADAPWFTLMPEDRWVAGQTQFICSARFRVPDGTSTLPIDPAKPLASTDGQPVISKIRSSAFPLSLRVCAPLGISFATSCAEKHQVEGLVDYNVATVFPPSFIKSVKPGHLTARQQKRFDHACDELLPKLLGKNYDASTMRARGVPLDEWKDPVKMANCEVVSSDDGKDLPPGSLVSAAN